MKSDLPAILGMTNQPVAVYKSPAPPEGAIQFTEGNHACVVAALSAAANRGNCTALRADTVGCYGGRCGLGFEKADPDFLGPFLAEGVGSIPGIRQKERPDFGKVYAENLPPVEIPAYLVFQPLDRVPEGITPSSITFLVEPDQLSGLVTLANFDRSGDGHVQLRYGAGCAQAIRYALCGEEAGSDTCYLGLTDPSSRLHTPKYQLSFAVPFHRFLEMEGKAAKSFLTGESWQKLLQRI